MKITAMIILLALAMACADARMPQVGDKVRIQTANSDIEGKVTEITDTLISVESYKGYNKIDACVGLGSITCLTWIK